ncbi:hypothetical protein pEaSNUABM29_00129 [Erwinia phage pEa_SNUABM_29]|nr:hypothetical protein pEaSNUABM29_00129 [Erwinia phage pEa_SNUABM_29]
MKIVEFYRSFLTSLGYGFDGDLLTMDDGHPAMFTYNKVKRRLALPTAAMIKNGMEDEDGSECHAFHPLCESVLAGESGTIRFLKKTITTNLFLKSFELIDAILETAAEGKTIRLAAYKKFLSDVVCADIKDPTMDKKLVQSWNAVKNYVYGLLEEDKKTKITRLFISSDMSIEGVKYIRVSNYQHMFEEESLDGTAMFFGAKLQRKQDKVILFNLLSAVFGWYPSVVGSNDPRPYFGSLARGWAQYVTNYNLVVRGLRDYTPLRPLEEEWIGELDNMHVFDNVIQTLPYNTGPRNEAAQDTTASDFRIGRTPSGTNNLTQRLASQDAPPADVDLSDPAAFFRAKKAQQQTASSNFNALPPALQRTLAENNGQIPKNSINNISLGAALRGQAETKQGGLGDGLLGNSSSSTNLLGNSGGLGGGGLGGDNLLGGSNNALGGLGGDNFSNLPFGSARI